MAWRAELRRRRWYCINHTDMINIYRKYRYDEWYHSLTDEQKQQLEERRQKEAEAHRREVEEAFTHLALMTGMIFDMYRIR